MQKYKFRGIEKRMRKIVIKNAYLGFQKAQRKPRRDKRDI